MRGFYRYLLRDGLISEDPTLQVELPQLGRPLPKSLSEADVEALLVNRMDPPHRHFITPMDRCYALVGVIRKYWLGLSGGPHVWEGIDAFFSELETDARSMPEEAAG